MAVDGQYNDTCTGTDVFQPLYVIASAANEANFHSHWRFWRKEENHIEKKVNFYKHTTHSEKCYRTKIAHSPNDNSTPERTPKYKVP